MSPLDLLQAIDGCSSRPCRPPLDRSLRVFENIRLGDDSPFTEQEQALDNILQFANISFPVEAGQQFEGTGTERSPLEILRSGQPSGKLLYENGNIPNPLPKRRNDKKNDIQPIVEIEAETSFPDLPVQPLEAAPGPGARRGAKPWRGRSEE